MSLFGDLNLNVDPDEIDKEMDANNCIPAGKYVFELTGTKPVKANTGSLGQELEFTAVGGPYDGKVIKDTLWKSDNERVKNRIRYFGRRLGLLVKIEDKDGKRYQYAEGKTDLSDCLHARVVLELEIEEQENKETKKTYEKNKIKWSGIWTLDDPAVADVVSGKAGVAAKATPAKAASKTAATNGAGAAAAKVDEFADL